MSRQAFEFAATIPAGTAIASPVTIPTTFHQREVNAIRWIIPPGALGVVGFYIGMRGLQLFPSSTGTWFVRSGHAGGVSVEDMPNTGDWSVTGYNTGAFNHTIYVTFEVSLIKREPSSPELSSLYDLSEFLFDPADRYA